MPLQTNRERTFLKKALLAALAAVFSAGLLFAQNDCTKTAQATVKLSVAEAMADYWQRTAGCINVKKANDRRECRLDAQSWLIDMLEEIEQQDVERRRICRLVGESRYAPVIEPNQFVDFEAILAGDTAFTPNPWFPLRPGTVWEYEGLDGSGDTVETLRVEVLNQSKEILGVQCIVVRDQVWEVEDGQEILVEDTDDFFAQQLDGTVWYFGEIAQHFEAGELVSLEGSWQAGRDGAQPGIIMPADPVKSRVYRQEFLAGEAEDVARVVSRNVVIVTVPFGTFADDVVRTREWSPLEPDTVDIKFYAPELGLVLESNPDTGEEMILVDMTLG